MGSGSEGGICSSVGSASFGLMVAACSDVISSVGVSGSVGNTDRLRFLKVNTPVNERY